MHGPTRPQSPAGCKEAYVASRHSLGIDWLRLWNSSRLVAGGMISMKTIQETAPNVECTSLRSWLTLWWNGPEWLKLDQEKWPKSSRVKSVSSSEEAHKLCSATCTALVQSPLLITFDHFSTFICLVWVTAWIIWFVTNCWSRIHWIKVVKNESWTSDIDVIKKSSKLNGQIVSSLSILLLMNQGLYCTCGWKSRKRKTLI